MIALNYSQLRENIWGWTGIWQLCSWYPDLYRETEQKAVCQRRLGTR